MQLEIQVALNFIISYLYNKLPRRRVNIFGEELERQLKKKYEGHWYTDKPYKGSGYRCLHVGEKVDPVVEQAAKESGLDLDDVRDNLPQDLSVWIDPFEVSYQLGEKGPVKVLYVDDNNENNGSELDKEIKNSFNPEAQVFMPISDSIGTSSESSSPSPPFGQSAAISPSFMPRSTYPITFTTATFAATKFGSTKMKISGRNNNNGNGNKVARTSPTNDLGLNVNTLMKQKAVSTSMYSLYGLGQQQNASALSPNAKEFVFPSLQGQGSSGGVFPSLQGQGSSGGVFPSLQGQGSSGGVFPSLQGQGSSGGVFPSLQGQGSSGGVFPSEGSLSLSPLQYNDAFDVFAAYGDLNDKTLNDGLNFNLSNMQYSKQQFQSVMAN
ncbi:protein Tob1-like [Oncorhynchus keta]|uniref:protein Tob1-like n=1 Tax=Oncorhynchus keta TaxID=8018 RepID=UPI00227D572D|nr:protein Tob1-like [Oncorhynchus keta]XP_035612206.2 protein Tob1-like [Oncorhynchus keta]XP_035612208.2 protein Tob1-like [Oncorhynchus keta]